jgi:hypothetical protein
MSWHRCPKCNSWRKVDINIGSDGWHQPACVHCGDPGYLEPFEMKEEKDMECENCGSTAHRDDNMDRRCDGCERLVRLCDCKTRLSEDK